MATSCKELWTNKNFLLKFAVFVCLCLLISFGHYYGYYNLVFGYEHSCLIIIISLIITYWLLESTKFTEVCLLVVALIKLLAALIIDATRARADYSCEQPKTVKKMVLPQPLVETRIMREQLEKIIVTTVKNFIEGSHGGPKDVYKMNHPLSLSDNSTILDGEVSENTTEKVEETDGPSPSLPPAAPGASYVSYRFAAPPTDDSWDNTSENIQFYVHIVICVIAIILVAVDIFLRVKK